MNHNISQNKVKKIQEETYQINVHCFLCILSTNLSFLFMCLQTSGLYEYKIMGSLEDVGPDVCKQVYMDLEYRKKWDEYVKGKSITGILIKE